MNPKPIFDPDFDHEAVVSWKRRLAAGRVCVLLLLLALVAGLGLFSLRQGAVLPATAFGAMPVLTANRLTFVQGVPGAPVLVPRAQPRDRFVVVANPAIDPQMVHRAPTGIDEKMVVPSRDRQADSIVDGGVPPEYFRVPLAPQVVPEAPAPTEPR